MQSILRAWTRYRPHLLNPVREGLRVKQDALATIKPLYERRPPWWARFTYTIILADLAVTAAMMELAWNVWTTEKEADEKAGTVTAKPAGEDTGANATATEGVKEYVRRPWYQRVPFAGAQMAVGVGIAMMVLTSHARVVRRIRIVPASSLVQNDAFRRLTAALKLQHNTTKPIMPKSAKKRAVPPSAATEEQFIMVEAASNRRGQGNVFPLKSCLLERGVNDKEVQLIVDGLRGKFWLGLPDAAVYGEKKSAWDAKEALYKAFHGKEGKKLMMRDGWKSGPAGST